MQEPARDGNKSLVSVEEGIEYMYIPDLATCEYFIESEGGSSPLCIGWLDSEYPYNQGPVPAEFVSRLWIFCRNSLFYTLGYHRCSLCRDAKVSGALIRYKGEELKLGSADIRVVGKDGTVYAAPNMIFHYVVDHLYQPPDEFIQAVLQGPLPDSPDYLAIKLDRNWR